MVSSELISIEIPDSQIYGANMGAIWGRQDIGWYHFGPMNFAIWDIIHANHIN